jgi:DNA-binding MarR family transcriptional regulator
MTQKTLPGRSSEAQPPNAIQSIVRDLARFRYALRRFLRFSEEAARKCGVTPQQHQLMLGIEGFTGRGSANVSELAEFLQERHHSVVGLIERAEQSGLVRRMPDAEDRRVVNVSLTRNGANILLKLTRMHYQEAKQLGSLWATCELPGIAVVSKKKLVSNRRAAAGVRDGAVER